MSKIMLVEDDEALREIYGIRLTAEGYTIVTAKDGEEALAVAVRERPDLILSDVMMPKISGFDMLDILRSTPETQGIKVIVMTALSSEQERLRGESLGADRYLVKSQVGIEDVVNVVHEVMGDRSQNGVITPAPQQQAAPTPAQQAPAAAGVPFPEDPEVTTEAERWGPVTTGSPDAPPGTELGAVAANSGVAMTVPTAQPGSRGAVTGDVVAGPVISPMPPIPPFPGSQV